MTNKPLKKGYTTGVHTSCAFKSALGVFLKTQKLTISKTTKMDNDDLDVTKGCEIVVTISFNKDDLELNRLEHKPYILKSNNNILELYAGVGVGVVTKDGLKPSKDYPAINPKPLEVLEKLFLQLTTFKLQPPTFYCSISVIDGIEIAKQTANEKVGVLGGISILGTTGFVKPISSTAYIDSIEQELNFIKVNSYDTAVLTLGNSSLAFAKENYNEEQIVEIGNFVYDSINLATRLKIKNIIFICGIGKMVKVYQGFKNTHNRFGSIDLEQIKDEIEKELKYNIDINSTKTVKGVSEQLDKVGIVDRFYEMIEFKANQQIQEWFSSVNIKAHILEDIDRIQKNREKKKNEKI